MGVVLGWGEAEALAPVGWARCSGLELAKVAVGVAVALQTSRRRCRAACLRRSKSWAALIVDIGGGLKLGSPALIAGLPGNSACVNVGPPLFCKRPKQRIRVDLIARAIQIAAAVVAANVVAVRGDWCRNHSECYVLQG